MHCLILDKDFHRLSLLHPVPPSHSTQGEGSLVCRKLDLDEQAGNVRDDEKLGHGEDGMQEGHMGDDFSSVSGSSPPHCRNHGEYQFAEYHQHDQHEEGPRLGAAAPSESQSWGDARPSSHHYDHNHWSTSGLGKESPPRDPNAISSDYQYNATQYYRPPEQSHSSPPHHSYDYGHGNYGYYTPPGYQYHGHAQADMYNHYNSPHYHPSYQPYYHYPHHSYYYPPPDYPAYNGQCHRPNQAHNQHDTYNYYQTSATGTLEEEAGQDKYSR